MGFLPSGDGTCVRPRSPNAVHDVNPTPGESPYVIVRDTRHRLRVSPFRQTSTDPPADQHGHPRFRRRLAPRPQDTSTRWARYGDTVDITVDKGVDTDRK